jgi:hypothetical protein
MLNLILDLLEDIQVMEIIIPPEAELASSSESRPILIFDSLVFYY